VVDSLEIGNDMARIMVKMKGDFCIIDNNKSLMTRWLPNTQNSASS
jgi:hypothetical protein